MHLELFMGCVAAVSQLKNNLITCERQYLKTYENVTDHIIFHKLNDIYYYFYSDL